MEISSTLSLIAIAISTVVSPVPSASLSAKSQANQVKVIASIAKPSPTPTPSPTPVPKPVYVASPTSLTDAQVDFLGNCESGMTAIRNSGNGFYGAFQFSIGTWSSMGTGYERADLAPLDVQKDAVQRLIARSSIFGQFPGCAAQMQAQGLL